MTIDVLIVFAITLAMTIMFFTGWIPIIAAAMSVPLLLQLTGILTFSEAWSGFSNSTVISFIPIFTMAAVLQKSSFTYRLKAWVRKLQSVRSGNFKVLAALVLATFLLTTFMNAASATAVMTPIILSIAAETGIPRKQALKICGDVSSNGILVLPLGLTLASYLTYNSYLEAGGADPQYMFSVMDQTILKAPIFLVWLVLMITVGTKFCAPKESGETLTVSVPLNQPQEAATQLTPAQDKLAMGLFFGSIVAMILFNQLFGTPIYLTCGLFALAAFAFKLITVNDALASMSWISIIIIACTLPLATAFNNTGASQIFADGVISIIGGSTNTYLLAAIFFIAPAFMTHFMSNTACAAIFSPLAVTTGVAIGVDPRFLLVASQMGAFSAFCTPMSTACEAIVFEAGKFKMGEFVRSGLFALISWFVLFMVWFPICSNLFFT